MIEFDPAFSATHKGTGHDLLLVGVNGEAALIIDEDGTISWADLGDININLRFENRTRKWIDVGGPIGEDQ